jgi:CrcB protein
VDRVIVIACAGALGAVTRYAMQGLANDLAGRPTVFGTLAVNLLGSLLLGVLIGWAEEHLGGSSLWRTAGAVGFLGAFTTFSTLMFESVQRLESGDGFLVLAYITSSIVLGLALCYAGLVAGRAFA